MFEGSIAKLNWRLFNHKKHLIILTIYSFLSLTLKAPYSSLTFSLMVIILIRDGFKHGKKQIKKTEPTYPQVIQPIFLGLMVAIYVGLTIRLSMGVLSENSIDEIPKGDILLYLFIFIALLMALLFFPLIVSSMISFLFYIPYYFGYKFGKYYGAKARRLQPDEMRDFIRDMKLDKMDGEQKNKQNND